MNSREKILDNIKTALKTPSHVPDDPDNLDQAIRDKIAEQTPHSLDGLIDQFKQELEIVSGEFIAANSAQDAITAIIKILGENNETSVSVAGLGLDKIVAHLPDNISVIKPEQLDAREKISTLAKITTAIVDIEYAIADSATLAIPFNKTNSTLPHFLPDCVIALVRKDQLIANHFELFEKMDPESAKNMLLVTGPSRTADIEKILILGAHGPRRLVVILVK